MNRYQINESFFTQLFMKPTYDRRTAFYADDQTTAFRFFNGEGDGAGGLTIDYYEGYYVFSWYSDGIYQQKDMLVEAFKKAVPEFKGIYEKNVVIQKRLTKVDSLEATKLRNLLW